MPYRSSKLTRLLEESLGGNTLTYMLAAISPEERNLRETLATLKYAQRAKRITNVKAKNEAKEEKRKIKELTAEIARLNGLMAAKRDGSIPGIVGRLGSLGTIAAEFDVAASTACAALDHFVVVVKPLPVILRAGRRRVISSVLKLRGTGAARADPLYFCLLGHELDALELVHLL